MKRYEQGRIGMRLTKDGPWADYNEAVAECDRLRAEVEALNERLHKIAASVNSLPTCKVAVDGVLWIPADRYNALIDVLRGEGEK